MDSGRVIGVFRYSAAAALCVGFAAAASVAGAQDNALGAAIAAKGTSAGAAACASCHGAKGEGNGAAGFPRLAGLSAPYIEAQLASFAGGQRQNPIMQPIAKALTKPESAAVALYFSKLPAAANAGSADAAAAPAQTGAWLATRGRWNDGLPACAQCHGPGGAGVGTVFPPLHGQSALYITNQLHAFKNKARPGGPMNLMSVVASKLSDADMTAVADYYGGQPASAAATGSQGGKK